MQVKCFVRMALSLLVCNSNPSYVMAGSTQNYLVPPIEGTASPAFKPSGPITSVRPASQLAAHNASEQGAQAVSEAAAPAEPQDLGPTDIFRRSRPDAFAKPLPKERL